MLASGCSDAKTEAAKNTDSGIFDTSRLPRMPGAKEIFASATSTIFVSAEPIGPTADSVDKALTAAGWQKYVAPHTAYRQDSTMRTMKLKKGSHALNVFITVAPAQNNAISVHYSMLPLKIDLPFTKDASNIEYSPERPSLKLVTAAPIEETLDFYRKEMAERGWSLWSEKTNGKQAPGGPSGAIHKSGGHARYISENTPSVTLELTVQKADAGKFDVEIKAWSVRALRPHTALISIVTIPRRWSRSPHCRASRAPWKPAARQRRRRSTRSRATFRPPPRRSRRCCPPMAGNPTSFLWTGLIRPG
jgi:hypothetical protein